MSYGKNVRPLIGIDATFTTSRKSPYCLLGGRDLTPVRGVPYEPPVLLGVSVEPRLSHFKSESWCWVRSQTKLVSEGRIERRRQ
jgi:hypothetical protein